MSDSLLGAVTTWLQYGGLLVATISSLWAATSELSFKDELGNKKLTRRGWFSIGLTVLSLTVSLSSKYLNDELSRAIAQRRFESDRERDLALILAQQPIRTIELTWSAPLTPELKSHLSSAEEDLEFFIEGSEDLFQSASPTLAAKISRYIERFFLHYNFLNFQASQEWKKESVLLLLPLEADQSTILPLGLLADESAYDDRDEDGSFMGIKRKDLPPGVDSQFEFRTWHSALYQLPRSRGCNFKTSYERKEAFVDFTWVIPSSCITTMFDRIDDRVPLTAYLPDSFKFLIFFDVKNFPLLTSSKLVASTPEWPFEGANSGPKTNSGILKIRINGLVQLEKRYSIERNEPMEFKEQGDDTQNFLGNISIFEAKVLRYSK